MSLFENIPSELHLGSLFLAAIVGFFIIIGFPSAQATSSQKEEMKTKVIDDIKSSSTTNKKPLKKISIVCVGSRGDFQPYLALAIELKKAGYHVRLLSIVTFQKFAEDFGIEFVVISNRCADKMLREDEKLRESMASGDIMKMFECIATNAIEDAPEMMKLFMNEMTNHTPDLFIEGTLCEFEGKYAQLVLNIPTIRIKLQSILYNPERAPLGLPTLPNGGHLNMLMNMMSMLYDGWAPKNIALASMGYKTLNDVYPKTAWMEDASQNLHGKDKQMLIVCQSNLFKDILAAGTTGGNIISFVGPQIVDAKQQTEHNGSFGGDHTKKQIDEFINADSKSKPVYCGWGSMICKSPEHMVQFVAKSLQISGERGIVLGGVAELSLELLKRSTSDKELIAYTEKNVLFVKYASHENLFPRMKCIVHHGGAGTTNAALRSGVPSIITPVFTDQFDHAYVLNKLGVGIGFSTQFQQITAEELGKGIRDVVNSAETKKSAKAVGVKISGENGKKVAVAKIQEFWNNLS